MGAHRLLEQGQRAHGDRPKKLIVATLLHFDPYDKIYFCGRCDKERRKLLGCRRNRRQKVAAFECICEGNDKCRICKGEGSFSIKFCPAAVFKRDRSLGEFMSYFFTWSNNGGSVFPDGRARIYQPLMMLEAFSVCKVIADRRIKKEMEKWQPRPKNK